MTGPSARSLERCRTIGVPAQSVERWIPQARKRIDLFGCIDIVCLDGQIGLLGIQATSDSNVSARVKKIKTECREMALQWLLARNRLEVWGWGKKGPRGKRKLWTCRIVRIELSDLMAEEAL